MKLVKFLKSHKTNMLEKAKHIFEGKKENKANLEDVYTEVFVVEGDIEEVNCEDEILKIDDALKSKKEPKSIECNDIFQSIGEKKHIVLIKGIAGIGKTFFVKKWILYWATKKDNEKSKEEKKNEIVAVFLLSFRQINQI